jgi:tetratricopeptide (TPR) repeat protein/CheY-like chemotaxis protein
VSRIVIWEDNKRTLRIIERCLEGMGYELFPIDDRERLRLDLRAHEPALILASCEMHGGSGLEVVRDHYPECRSPVPVIVYSNSYPRRILREITPAELNVGAFLGKPIDPGELVRTVVGLAPAPDPVTASKIVADLRAEYEQHGLRLEEPSAPVELADKPFAQLLWAIDHNSWTGKLSLDGEGEGAVDWWFVMGQFTHAATHGDRDLVTTAILEKRLDASKLPPVALKNVEEQLGLLMAYRAIGMHESEALARRTVERLLKLGLDLSAGTITPTPGEWKESQTGEPSALPRLVMKLIAGEVAEVGRTAIQAHPDSVVVIRLPPSATVRAWGLTPGDHKVLDLIEKARNREITLDQLVRVASEGVASVQPRVRALIQLLGAIGFLEFRGKPWDRETSDTIDELVATLHRANRGNPFEVLGLASNSSEQEIKTRAREFARKYHPDAVIDQHPRVRALAGALFAASKDAAAALSDKNDREALRINMQQTRRGGSSGGQPEPEKARVALKQGELYLRNKAYEEAETFFRDATLLDPDNPDGFAMLGWTRFLKDPTNTTLATKTLETAIKLNPKHADAWFYLGRIALIRKDNDRARRRFQKALEFDPKHVGAGREVRLMDRRLAEGDRRKEPRQQGLRGLFGRRKED